MFSSVGNKGEEIKDVHVTYSQEVNKGEKKYSRDTDTVVSPPHYGI